MRLVDRANVGAVIEAVLSIAARDGAEREAQQAFGLAANQIPFDMLRGPRSKRAPSRPRPRPWAPSNPRSCNRIRAGRGGVSRHRPADRRYGRCGLSGAYLAADRGGAARGQYRRTRHHGAYDADLLGPQRLQASFTYRRVDAARFRGMDQSLRAALNSGLEEALDKELVVGARAC